MTVDFTAVTIEGDAPGVLSNVGAPAVNFHGAGAADTLDRMGLPVIGWGETPIGYVEDLATAALAQHGLDETDPAARRLCQVRDLARRGAQLGATHIAWA